MVWTFGVPRTYVRVRAAIRYTAFILLMLCIVHKSREIFNSMLHSLDVDDRKPSIISRKLRRLNHSLFQFTKQEDPLGVIQKSLDLVRAGCEVHSRLHRKPPMCNLELEHKSLFSLPEKKFFFCTVSKIGSTFWTKLLNSTGTIHKTTGTNNKAFLQFKFYRKALFVRDPYRRLLSMYVDKFILPNHMYWDKGREIVRKYRKYASSKSLRCGHDVSFAEFIKEVVDSLKQDYVDMHFRPIHRHCCPCDVNYDFIGHFETMQQDTQNLLKASNIFGDKIPDFATKDSAASNLNSSISNVFRRIRNTWLKNCVTDDESLQRIYIRQQILGNFHPNVSFREAFSSGMEFRESQRRFSELLLKQGNRSQRSARGHQAMVEIYRSIPLEDLFELQRLYHWDFVLYGYEQTPTYLFDRKVRIEHLYAKPPIVFFRNVSG